MILMASPGRNGITHMPRAAPRVFFVWIMNQAVPMTYRAAVPSTMKAGSFHLGSASVCPGFTPRPVISAQGR